MGYPHVVKKCADCCQVKPVAEFYASKGRPGGERDGFCKECRRARDRLRQASRNKDIAARLAKDPLYFRRKKLIRMYGITVEDFDAMLARQGGVCAICQKPESRVLYGQNAALVVDHNHQTGKMRDLLCHRCNTSLGIVEDAEFLAKALAYLKAHA